MAAEGGGGNYDNPNNKPDVKAGVKPPITPEVLGNVLAAIDFYHTEQSKTEEVKEQLSRVMTETFGSHYKSVDELDKVIEQGGNTDEVREVKRYKKLLIDGVDVALRKKRESGQISDDELRFGSQHLTNGLHEVIKGVGGDVSDRYVDKGLDSHLNRLEAARLNRNSHIDDVAYTEMLLQRIDMAIPKVLSVDTDNGDAVVVALNHERANLRTELGYEPNSSVASVGSVEQKGVGDRRKETSTEGKKRAPGPTAENNRITGENSEVIEENNRILGELIKSMRENTAGNEANTAALDRNTQELIKLTEAANKLGVSIENLTTAINKEQIDRVVAQLEDSGVNFAALEDADRDILVERLAREVDDPLLVDAEDPIDIERVRGLKEELSKATLLRRLDRKIANERRGRPPGGELNLPPEIRERWDGSVEMLYRWLNDIEQGDRSVDDLSTNSGKFGILYHVKNGEYDNFFENNPVMLIDRDGRLVVDSKSEEKPVEARKMTHEEVKQMKNEIDMRLFLHSFYRAASKCVTIDDMAKVIIAMHEGDYENGADKAIVSFFLNRVKGSRGVGLEKLPTDMAWDMRQNAYFRIEEFTERMKEKKQSFFDGLKEMMAGYMKIEVDDFDALGEMDADGNLLWTKITNAVNNSEVGGDTFKLFQKIAAFDSTIGKWILNTDGFDKLTEKEVAIKDWPQFGFDKPVNKNLDYYEQKNSLKGVLIKEYTVWQMMKNKSGYSQDKARKAYTLTQRLSVATFMKNKANLIFDQDKYAEKLNLMLERLDDGPGGKRGRRGKSKLVGAVETLGYINSFTCHWMDTLKSDFIGGDKPRRFESVYSPLYTIDIDWSKYNYRTTQMYHILGVLSQVEFVDDALRNKASYKDVTAPGFLNDLFSKMNKILYEMNRGKVKALEIKDRPNFYNRFTVVEEGGGKPKIETERPDSEYARAEVELAEMFRYDWVVNVLSRVANEKTLGWTTDQLDDFIQELGHRSTLFGIEDPKTGEIRGSGFVDRELLKKAIKETKVYQAVRDYDKQREDAAKVGKEQQNGFGWGSLFGGKRK